MHPGEIPRVGFIGLGSMGSGMTNNLMKAGFPLVVHDVDQHAVARCLAAGAQAVDTPAAVAAACDVAITMLPTPAVVSVVANGAAGLLAGIPDGGTWIEMSTSVPAVTEDARRRSAGRGIVIMDAPVSGMSVGAANGTLQIFIGGQAGDVQRWRPVLEAMGDPQRILHVGPAGAGYATKLMINQLWFSHLVATAEVLSVGVQAGVRLDVLRNALIASPANSNFLERDVLSILNDGDYDEGFAIGLACKDLGAVAPPGDRVDHRTVGVRRRSARPRTSPDRAGDSRRVGTRPTERTRSRATVTAAGSPACPSGALAGVE